jgi:HK97 family phage portal protein
MRLADVYAAVRRLALSAASCPIQVYVKNAVGSREQVTKTATTELLDRPSPGVTQPELVAGLVSSLALTGEAVLGKYRGADGEVAQLQVLAPDRLKVEVIGGEYRFAYTSRDGHINENLTFDDVIFVRMMTGLDGVRGLSPVSQVRESFSLAKSLTESSAALWANGGKPTGILKVPSGPQGEEQAENLAKGWESRHGGPKSAGRVAVVTGDIGWEPVSLSLADAEWIATRNLSTAEICRIIGVQPFLLGAPTGDSMTYANVAMQAEAHVKFDLLPLLRLVEAAMSADADLCPAPGQYVKFNLDELLRADAATRMSVYEKGISNGVLTADEARAQEDLPPLNPAEGREESPDG